MLWRNERKLFTVVLRVEEFIDHLSVAKAQMLTVSEQLGVAAFNLEQTKEFFSGHRTKDFRSQEETRPEEGDFRTQGNKTSTTMPWFAFRAVCAYTYLLKRTTHPFPALLTALPKRNTFNF